VSGIDDEFLTVADIARILKLNQQTVRNWIDQGSLPALHVGRRVRIRRSDFERFLDQGRTQPPAEPDASLGQAFWDGEIPPQLEPTEHD
jgi:excisionase family DNA binding protein